jgi:hypothetical protein
MMRGIDKVLDTTIRTCNRDLATPINGLVEIGKDWEPVPIVRTWPTAANAPTAANEPTALGQQTGRLALAGRPAIARRATARRRQGTQGPVVARRTAEPPELPMSVVRRAAAAGRGSRAADIEPQHSAVAVVEDSAAAAVEGFVAAAGVVAAEVAVAGAGQTLTSSTM